MSENIKIIADLQNENERLRARLTILEEAQVNRREIDTFFTNFLEIIPASIHILQGNHFCYVNTYFTQTVGYSFEECQQLFFWDLIHPDYKDIIKERAWARQRGEIVEPVREFKVIAKSGHELWVDHTAANVIWRGKPAVMAVLHDLTERKYIEDLNYQQHEQLRQTYSELEEVYSELQSSQLNLMEINTRLRESEERLGLALWAAEEGFWDWDLETGNLFFSDLEASKLGYQYSDYRPHIDSWIALIHPEDLPGMESLFSAFYKGSTDYYEAEYRLRSKSGKYMWVLDRGKVVKRNEAGKARRILGVKRFIDKEKAMQEALQKSENRYRTFMETIPEIVARCDKKGKFLWVNKPGLDFFGENVYQNSFRNYLYHASDYGNVLRAIMPSLRNNQTAQTETMLVRQDGEPRILKWQSRVYFENNQPVGSLSTARDITETRKAELQLRESEDKYRQLFEKSPVGLIKVDINGNITDANEYYIKMTGAPSKKALTCINIFDEALVRTDIAAIIEKILKQYKLPIEHFNVISSRADLSAIVETVLKYNQVSGVLFTEMEYMSRWGIPLCMQYRIDPWFDDNNQIQYMIIVCEEISARKKAEARIKYLSYNDSLTGLHNRAFFDEELVRLDAPQYLPLSIIIGDVNGLKLTNDTFGHAAGDSLLKNIARILRLCCRSEDVVARWGGDEFIVLLPRTSGASAASVCERIKSACGQESPDPIQPSLALGLSSKEYPEKDINKVITEAEDAMYRNKLQNKKESYDAILIPLEDSLHGKSIETKEHIQRIQTLCLKFARALDLSANEIERLLLLARLHDIGYIGIEEELLQKSDQLTAEEWSQIKKHPEIGYRIASTSPDIATVAEEILCHHESWDGSGYPKGLPAYEIPLLARIISIVNAYDAITFARPYKKPLNHNQAVQEIRRCSATQFDPQLVEVFLSLFRNFS